MCSFHHRQTLAVLLPVDKQQIGILILASSPLSEEEIFLKCLHVSFRHQFNNSPLGNFENSNTGTNKNIARVSRVVDMIKGCQIL